MNPTAGQEMARKQAARAHAKERYLSPAGQTEAERLAIEDYYTETRALGMTVDHIVAANHPHLVGLHTLVNLQRLSRSENGRKAHHLPPDLTPEDAVARGMAVWR